MLRSIRSHIVIASGLAALTALGVQASAQEAPTAPLQALVESQLRAIAQDPVVVEAVKAQNAEYASLTQADIDKLDQQWKTEATAADKPLIGKVLANAVSKYLAQAREQSKGLYNELFVMDDKGLNVGASDATSDYWQGDEDKWQKTYSVGPDAVFVDKVEQDESTQQLQSQVSFSIVDPATRTAIGAMTVGVNLDALDN